MQEIHQQLALSAIVAKQKTIASVTLTQHELYFTVKIRYREKDNKGNHKTRTQLYRHIFADIDLKLQNVSSGQHVLNTYQAKNFFINFYTFKTAPVEPAPALVADRPAVNVKDALTAHVAPAKPFEFRKEVQRWDPKLKCWRNLKGIKKYADLNWDLLKSDDEVFLKGKFIGVAWVVSNPNFKRVVIKLADNVNAVPLATITDWQGNEKH